jgi:hypothetical protein
MTKTIILKARRGGLGPKYDLKSFGLAVQRAVESRGGTCLPMWANDVLTVAIQGVRQVWVQELVASFVAASEKAGDTLSILQVDSANIPENSLPSPHLVPGAVIRERLTKKFLLSLPPCAYVISNCFTEDKRPIFAALVGESRSRGILWKNAVETGAAHRMCDVVWTEAEFIKAAFPDLH